ncbi:hypothetical protein TNCV_661761 [Trichonephila clavipes]|nr:hypothetical protein TNCV_661761 [Trichonephila clavipes]
MATVDFLHQENPPIWAEVEPTTLDAEDQRQSNHATQPAILELLNHLATCRNGQGDTWSMDSWPACHKFSAPVPLNSHQVEPMHVKFVEAQCRLVGIVRKFGEMSTQVSFSSVDHSSKL